ncbi:MAG TPA: hypothetical protein VFG47_00480 [Geminicoccaceae bacterium]|nr:hypothetical protein [Geminicoccaceae bacterium]
MDDDRDVLAPRQPGLRPINRVGQGGLAGVLATFMLFALNHLTDGEITVPGEVGAAIATLASFVVGCLARERGPDADGGDDEPAAGRAAARRRAG